MTKKKAIKIASKLRYLREDQIAEELIDIFIKGQRSGIDMSIKFLGDIVLIKK